MHRSAIGIAVLSWFGAGGLLTAQTGAAVVVGVLDASGSTSLPILVPNTPGLVNAPVWLQAVQGTAPVFSLRASTVAGGTVR